MENQGGDADSQKCNAQKIKSSLTNDSTKSVQQLVYGTDIWILNCLFLQQNEFLHFKFIVIFLFPESRDDHLYPNQMDCPRVQQIDAEFWSSLSDNEA